MTDVKTNAKISLGDHGYDIYDPIVECMRPCFDAKCPALKIAKHWWSTTHTLHSSEDWYCDLSEKKTIWVLSETRRFKWLTKKDKAI